MPEEIVKSEKMTGEEKISRLRKAVKEHQYFKFKEKGHRDTMDAYTASAIMQIYDALSPENKKRLASMSYTNMSASAWKLLAKVM